MSTKRTCFLFLTLTFIFSLFSPPPAFAINFEFSSDFKEESVSVGDDEAYIDFGLRATDTEYGQQYTFRVVPIDINPETGEAFETTEITDETYFANDFSNAYSQFLAENGEEYYAGWFDEDTEPGATIIQSLLLYVPECLKHSDQFFGIKATIYAPPTDGSIGAVVDSSLLPVHLEIKGNNPTQCGNPDNNLGPIADHYYSYLNKLDEERAAELKQIAETETTTNSKGGITNMFLGSSSSGLSSLFKGSGSGMVVATIAVFVASLIVALVIFFLVVSRKKRPGKGFVGWLYEYLNFRDILVVGIIKFAYLFLAIFLTIYSFVIMIMGGPIEGLLILVFGNVGLRIFSELIMATVGVWQNSGDILKYLNDKDESRESLNEPLPSSKPSPEQKPVETEVKVESTETIIAEQPPKE